VRLLLAATLSPTYGIYSGFELCENTPRSEGSEEYLNSEKYELKHRDFDAPGNLNDDIRRINRIRHENPALQQHVNLAFHQAENDQVIFYRKWSGDNDLLMVVNTDPEKVQESTVQVPLSDLGLASEESYELEDLMTGERHRWHGSANYVRLDPEKQAGHILRLVRSGESGL
ncbi:MAG: alpha-1,4-glucan--maltose-1-phosphate maltosyltransferase, partial [Anaerolineales bacterium]